MARDRVPGILAFVPDVWENAWMTRHQIVTRLARFFPVAWMDRPREWRDMLKIHGQPIAQGDGPLPSPDTFALYRPRWPMIYRPRAAADFFERRRIAAARGMLRRRQSDSDIVYLWHPEYAHSLDLVPHRLSCYHVDDEYSFSSVEKPVSDLESALLSRVDEVIIHSAALWEKKSGLAKHASLIPNGVDFSAYSTPTPEPEDLRAIPHPRIGYVGVVKGQLNLPLLVSLSERHPEWSFVLVGPVRSLGTDAEAFEVLNNRSNVHLLGGRPVATLPAYVQHMDVGIMPYDVDDYTKYIYPLKLHEYLATGVPTVASPIRTLQDFGNVLALVEGADAWSAAIAAALDPAARSPEAAAARRAVAAEHDWWAIARRIALLFASRLDGAWNDRITTAVRADAAANPIG
ncbi:MAG TPA: glycosyltransferase [Gemmatimonadaceae bacterium]|nr:glycosyltransferase [Gemmatimonadaceae bacterium]